MRSGLTWLKSQYPSIPEMDEARQAALNKQLETSPSVNGDGSIMRLGELTTIVESIPTGSLSLDIALGVGGYTADVSAEIYGPNHR